MSDRALSGALFVVAALGLAACASASREDASTDLSALNGNASSVVNAPNACYAPANVPGSYVDYAGPQPSAACDQASLQGYFQACYTATATKDTCSAWNAANANSCGQCVTAFSKARPDASGGDSGLPFPNSSACFGAQLGSCVQDVAKFSQCASSVCSSCSDQASLGSCQGQAASDACNTLASASNACVTQHQADLAVCSLPSQDQLAANPALGGQFLVQFYVGACLSPAAWAPAPPQTTGNGTLVPPPPTNNL